MWKAKGSPKILQFIMKRTLTSVLILWQWDLLKTTFHLACGTTGSQGVTKLRRINLMGTINIFAKFNGKSFCIINKYRMVSLKSWSSASQIANPAHIPPGTWAFDSCLANQDQKSGHVLSRYEPTKLTVPHLRQRWPIFGLGCLGCICYFFTCGLKVYIHFVRPIRRAAVPHHCLKWPMSRCYLGWQLMQCFSSLVQGGCYHSRVFPLFCVCVLRASWLRIKSNYLLLSAGVCTGAVIQRQSSLSNECWFAT